jgi:hypothetical protein
VTVPLPRLPGPDLDQGTMTEQKLLVQVAINDVLASDLRTYLFI